MLVLYMKGSAHANSFMCLGHAHVCRCQALSTSSPSFREADVQPTHHIAAEQEVSKASDDLGASFNALLGVATDRRQMGRGHT